MSTIVAVQKNGEICIACESLTTFNAQTLRDDMHEGQSKLLRWWKSYIASIGDTCVRQALADIIAQSPEPELSNISQIRKAFHTIHKKLKDEYFLRPDDEEDDPTESSHLTVLIANTHGIFGMLPLRETYKYTKFWAFGSGEEYALWAMHALYEKSNMTAENIAQAGIQAGKEFDKNSDGTVILKTFDTA